MASGKYLFGMIDNLCYLKMVGDMKYTHSGVLDDFLENLMKNESCSGVVIDLSDTEWIDSTNLGLIAKFARLTHKKSLEKPILFSTNQNLNTLLTNMGFNSYFHLIDHLDENQLELEEMQQMKQSSQEMKKIMLEAHEHLIEMSPENEKKFKNVVNILKNSI